MSYRHRVQTFGLDTANVRRPQLVVAVPPDQEDSVREALAKLASSTVRRRFRSGSDPGCPAHGSRADLFLDAGVARKRSAPRPWPLPRAGCKPSIGWTT